jgi:hypothetical protein
MMLALLPVVMVLLLMMMMTMAKKAPLKGAAPLLLRSALIGVLAFRRLLLLLSSAQHDIAVEQLRVQANVEALAVPVRPGAADASSSNGLRRPICIRTPDRRDAPRSRPRSRSASVRSSAPIPKFGCTFAGAARSLELSQKKTKQIGARPPDPSLATGCLPPFTTLLLSAYAALPGPVREWLGEGASATPSPHRLDSSP